MAWVVDTCILLDVILDDPLFAQPSVELLNGHLVESLVIAPATYIELSPAFAGNRIKQDDFLTRRSIDFWEDWTREETREAHRLWHDYSARRRSAGLARRPLADVLIAAFCLRRQGLLTRNADDFRKIAPNLPIVDPTQLS